MSLFECCVVCSSPGTTLFVGLHQSELPASVRAKASVRSHSASVSVRGRGYIWMKTTTNQHCLPCLDVARRQRVGDSRGGQMAT